MKENDQLHTYLLIIFQSNNRWVHIQTTKVTDVT